MKEPVANSSGGAPPLGTLARSAFINSEEVRSDK